MLTRLKYATFNLAGRQAAGDLRNTIVLAGTPRPGTTWLLELFRTLPGYKALNEPLMYEDARYHNGFDWRTHIAPDGHRPQERAYLQKILRGRLGISPAWYFEADDRLRQLVEHTTRHKLVVKFCRINRMLHWFCRQFSVRGPVLIVRHPCAVVASMLRHGAWDEGDLHGQDREDHALHAVALPDPLRDVFGPILERIETQVEALATMWCLDHYVPLVHHGDGSYPWVIVPYERMVSRGREELRRITQAMDVERTSEMQEQLDEPSQSVKDQLHRDAERQLSKWQRRLSEKQVEDILRIVEEVGLSEIYTRELEPDYDQLNEMQNPEAQW